MKLFIFGMLLAAGTVACGGEEEPTEAEVKAEERLRRKRPRLKPRLKPRLRLRLQLPPLLRLRVVRLKAETRLQSNFVL